ncbi:MAG: ATP-binding response regulator, partial [Tepidisphaeraceae bacterium]
PEEAKQGLTVIERNARTQARLVDDLLDMSRIISGKIGLEIKPVRLPEIIDAAIHTVQPAAEAKGVVLRFLPHSPELPTVSGDSNRLQQVVWNLLSNAVKFTPRGGRVEIGLEAFANGVQLAVADTGEGIAPTFLPHVFDRFRQADGTTTRRHGGLGLGLSIVKNLVELHGGSIRALSSGKDRGSTFVVTLPITTPARDADAGRTHQIVTAAEEEAEPCEIRLDGLKVLVIDDEPDAREVVRRFLETCGARVALANSVDDAMRTLPAQESDVIISDIGMPGQDGYELIRRVRALSNDQRLIPAIALTAFARAEDNRRAVDAGYNAHLAKPVTRTSLLRTVGQLVGKS